MKLQSIILLGFLLILSSFYSRAQVFEPVGGPYTADSTTMLLLHFDGNFNNESRFSKNARAFGSYMFLPSFDPNLGQCLRLDNDSPNDSSYVIVPDTSYLDLVGSWTIEGWINIFTFGETSSDWRWVPRLAIKPGDDVFWLPNYFVEMWGDRRFFSCGYNVAGQYNWPQVNTQDNIMEVGKWYHLTFIRDTTRHILISMIHDADRKLIFFGYTRYNPITDDPPRLNNKPVHIGFAGGGTDSWLDGFVDEIRICNTVRKFAIPPIIELTTKLENQPDTLSGYTVKAKISPYWSSGIKNAYLHYSTGATWDSVAMTLQGDEYVASIPAQPAGTVVKYYISATDNDNLWSRYPWEPSILQFAVYKPKTQTLYLTFEEGSGIPQDYSMYANPVNVYGNAVYSSDAKEGTKSLYFDGDSYLEVNSPVLISTQYTVDLWFKPDTIVANTYIINQPIVRHIPQWNTYVIGINVQGSLYGGYWSPVGGGRYVTIALDSTISPGKWYRAILEVSADTAVFELRDASNVRIQRKGSSEPRTLVPVTPANLPPNIVTLLPIVIPYTPLHIGYAGTGAHYKGFIDDLKIYNYSTGIITYVEKLSTNELPLKFELYQNYPNPFNPNTTIKFAVPYTYNITLEIYDMLGRKVKTLVNGLYEPGEYRVVWDGTNEAGNLVSSGIYFYQLKAGNILISKKMMLVK
jgi:hypothetical protein